MTEESSPADATVPVPPSTQPSTRRVWMLLGGFAVLAYVLDQLTKWWVVSTMYEGQTTWVLPPVLRWYFIRNSGAAFSIGEDFTWFFSLVMAAVSVAIIVVGRKVSSAWWAVALGLVLGGALGNLTDRLFREPSFGMGHVVDFISFPNFAIFNLADSAVVGGVALICILTLKGIPMRAAAAGTDDAGKAASAND